FESSHRSPSPAKTSWLKYCRGAWHPARWESAMRAVALAAARRGARMSPASPIRRLTPPSTRCSSSSGGVSFCSGNPQWMGHMAILIRRREFIMTLGGAAVRPLAAGAQHGAQLVRRIGILSGFAEDPLVESELLRPLSQLNRDNGRNMQIDLRW